MHSHLSLSHSIIHPLPLPSPRVGEEGRLVINQEMDTPTNTDGPDRHYYPTPPPFPPPFRLLEVRLVSAQDLYPATRSSMRTYAVAFIEPDHKLRTRNDPDGHVNPTWNDKFVFRVDDATLRSPTSSINVDIYAARSKFLPGSDTLLGTARAMISMLSPGTATRYVALQVRRPNSLRPQGILNIGVTLIEGPGEAEGAVKKEVKMVRSESMKEMEKQLAKWRGELPKEGRGVNGIVVVSRRTNGKKSMQGEVIHEK